MADEELKINITVNGDKAKKSLDGLKDSTKNLSSSFMKIVPGGSAISSALKNVGELAEQVGTKFGMSAEAAASMGAQIAALGPVAVAVGAALALLAAEVVAVAAAVKLVAKAAPLETIAVGFDMTAARAGVMGDEVMAAMQKASGGMLSMQTLMTKFNDAAQLVSPQFAVASVPQEVG